MPSHLPKSPFTRWEPDSRDTNRRVPLLWWWSPDVATTPRYSFFYSPVWRVFYLHALGVSAGLWQRLHFSLRNGEAKQTELSAFRSKLNRRTTVWPAVHNILFQHWLHLKQTLSRPIHLSQRERNLRKGLHLNSINKSHSFFLLLFWLMFSPSAGQMFSLTCHLCRSCVLWRHARTASEVCGVGWERGLKGHRSACYKRAVQSMAYFYCKSI